MASSTDFDKVVNTTQELEDFKNQISNIINDLESHPEKINDLTDEQAIEVEKYLNPYGATIYGDEKYTCVSFTNLREKYMQKLLTTALIGFTYQMCDEYTIEDLELTTPINKEDFKEFKENPNLQNRTHVSNLEDKYFRQYKKEYILKTSSDDKLKTLINIDITKFTTLDEMKDHKKVLMQEIDSYELSEDVELDLRSRVNKTILDEHPPIESTDMDKYMKTKENAINTQSEEEKVVIKKFLNKLFKYDPKLHTISSFNTNTNDPERPQTVEDIPKNKFTENIPPNDTYSRFQYYFEVNYEELRESVLMLYNEKPDIEVAMNIFETFDSLAECDEYIQKNKNNIITNMLTLTNNKWNLLGPFKKNRERISFYNENTQVLENILKQQENDSKMGKKLLDERVRKRKVKNIKEYGKTDPRVAQYLKENPNDITANSSKVEILEDKVVITEETEISETGAAVDEDGTPLDCVEIGVTSINARTNQVTTSKIYTKAHAPDMNKK